MGKLFQRARKRIILRRANREAKKDEPLTYRAAGVDIEAGDRLVALLKPLCRATIREEVLEGIGGFAGLIHYPGDPGKLLAASTDGVGTKLLLAIEYGRHEGVGQDLVAMCVNDLICVGARPLFFLDYYASAKLAPELAARVIGGVAAACREVGCVLLGGETAELPGMYPKGVYDLAGFAVGTLARSEMFRAGAIRQGDVVLGLASSGLHSNGYSLARRVFGQKGLPAALVEELLCPTRLYVRAAEILREGGVALRGLAHITGGGLVGNLPRILPEGRKARLKKGSWHIPEIFLRLAREGKISEEEMLKTFNVGIGLCAVVTPEDAERAQALLQAGGYTSFRIGVIEEDAGAPEVLWEGPSLF